MRELGVAIALMLSATSTLGATLTFSGEARMRYDSRDGHQQGLFRGILGADLRINPRFRMYGEVGTGQVAGGRDAAAANFQNDTSLQQLFVDVRGNLGATLAGATIGRQEFAEGPRQLISISDGPNLHRTWNGVRLYAHGRKLRAGAYSLRATRLRRGSFDEKINRDERLEGVHASFAVSPDVDLDAFWMHSGIDTAGARLRGHRGDAKFDWTVARQSGDAWGVFAVQSVALSDAAWKPRLTTRVDVASARFHQLYASSNYLGEGQFLSLRNLLMLTPGISLSPTRRTNVAIEYGFARRLTDRDAAYAGGMRAYAATRDVSGHGIGGLLRITPSFAATDQLKLFLNFERFDAGPVLERAHAPSRSYAYAGATLRY